MFFSIGHSLTVSCKTDVLKMCIFVSDNKTIPTWLSDSAVLLSDFPLFVCVFLSLFCFLVLCLFCKLWDGFFVI